MGEKEWKKDLFSLLLLKIFKIHKGMKKFFEVKKFLLVNASSLNKKIRYSKLTSAVLLPAMASDYKEVAKFYSALDAQTIFRNGQIKI